MWMHFFTRLFNDPGYQVFLTPYGRHVTNIRTRDY